jgi:hypothetical protein
MTEKTIPAGYWEDAKGALWPVGTIKPIDKDRTRTIQDLCEAAEKLSSQIIAFKLASAEQIDEFVERSAAEYKVELRGMKGKGNLTLTTFSGHYKVVRQMADTITFDERLQVAKQLIDSCIQRWNKGSNANIKALVNDAFQVDKTGKINTGRVLALRRIEIIDDEWKRAMEAISDSMRVASTKSYTRYYKRVDESGEYVAINLDVAAA